MATRTDTGPVKVDQFGNLLRGGHDASKTIAMAQAATTARTTASGVSGRLSNAGGTPDSQNRILAVPDFTATDLSSGDGPTKGTLDSSLALVNDALAAIFTDANAVASALGIEQVTYNGGGTAASPINAITGAGSAGAQGPAVATMNTIRDQIDTNMHTAARLVNKLCRALWWSQLDVEDMPMRQPPPDSYGAGSTGTNSAHVKGGGSGQSFGEDSPYTDPTPAITENSGTHQNSGVSKEDLDDALDVWRNNVETMAHRLALMTNSVVALTDNSGGTAQTDNTIDLLQAFDDDAALSSDGADDTEFEAAASALQLDIALLFSKANELAAGLGVPQITYNGGGAVANDTLEVIDDTLATDATGPVKSELDAWVTRVNEAFDACAFLVQNLAKVTGAKSVNRGASSTSAAFDNPVNPETKTHPTSGEDGSGAIPTTFSTNATGQTDTAVEARLTAAKNNVALLAERINGIRTKVFDPLVQVV